MLEITNDETIASKNSDILNVKPIRCCICGKILELPKYRILFISVLNHLDYGFVCKKDKRTNRS